MAKKELQSLPADQRRRILNKTGLKRQAMGRSVSNLVLDHAKTHGDSAEHDQAMEAAAELDRQGRALEQAAQQQPAEAPGAIYQLPANASAPELKEARRTRAVRRGAEVYLPAWHETVVGLPDIFLRSSLFSASDDHSYVEDMPIAAQGDVTLAFTGFTLNQIDKCVFAACLAYYQDSPLHHDDEQHLSISVTFRDFFAVMGLQYSTIEHYYVRKSLRRLQHAGLSIRLNRVDLPVERLVTVAFEDGYRPDDDLPDLAFGKVTRKERDRLRAEALKKMDLRGSDRIHLRVTEAIATLFGPACWSTVSLDALTQLDGLQGWLAGYYSTHSKPYDVPVLGEKSLHTWSGSRARPNDFKGRDLPKALDALKEVAQSDARVAGYLPVNAKGAVKVTMAAWHSKAK